MMKLSRLSAIKTNLLLAHRKFSSIINSSKQTEVIPLKIPKILFPCDQAIKLDFSSETFSKVVEFDDKEAQYGLFYEGKDKSVLEVGVFGKIHLHAKTNEITIKSISSDKRILIPNIESVKFDGTPISVMQFSDENTEFDYLSSSFARNIAQDVNDAILFYDSHNHTNIQKIEKNINELNRIMITLTDMRNTNKMLLETAPHAASLNKLIFTNFASLIRLYKILTRTLPITDIKEVLMTQDKIMRAKKLIDMIFELSDFTLKESFLFDKYKKDYEQRQKKYLYRFMNKEVDKIVGTESKEEYIKKLEEIDIAESAKNSIRLEIDLAFTEQNDEQAELEDKKANTIVKDIFNFPWMNRDKVEFDLNHAKKVLDDNLFGLNKVKERIYEYIAKLKRTHEHSKKGFIILITGTPGTGKTTIAQLIGKALKRKSTIINLSGQSDAIVLKGSRRTYVDSQPSVFFKEMVKVGVKNPVFIIDEIDKVSESSASGTSPASALLELLNPEENHNFVDQYLNVPLDFSEVVFICTGNYMSNMLEPLLDRLEVIEINDYTLREKEQITESFIIPKVLKEFGFNGELVIKDEAVKELVAEFQASHGGVRTIGKIIERLIRKANFHMIQKQLQSLVIDRSNVHQILSYSSTSDVNFKFFLQKPQLLGECLTAQSNYLSKVMIKIHPYSSKEDDSRDCLFKNIHFLVKLSKPVEEAFDIARRLAREKLHETLPLNKLKKLSALDYNVYINYPYDEKQGNAYGLAFYLALLGISENQNTALDRTLVAGELGPHGNVFKVQGFKNMLGLCEYFGIENLIASEGNKEDYVEFVKNTNFKMTKVAFVSHVSQLDGVLEDFKCEIDAREKGGVDLKI